jgi:hypothetical protein
MITSPAERIVADKTGTGDGVGSRVGEGTGVTVITFDEVSAVDISIAVSQPLNHTKRITSNKNINLTLNLTIIAPQ